MFRGYLYTRTAHSDTFPGICISAGASLRCGRAGALNAQGHGETRSCTFTLVQRNGVFLLSRTA